MDAIARASGVSKATIYNHWADKEALLMEVMLFVNGLDREPEEWTRATSAAIWPRCSRRQPPDEFDADARSHDAVADCLLGGRTSSSARPGGIASWSHRGSVSSAFCAAASTAACCRLTSISICPWRCCSGPMLYAHVFNRADARRGEEVGTETARAFWQAYAADPKSNLKTASVATDARTKKDRRPTSQVAGSLERLVAQLENDAALASPDQLARRLEALDVLDLCGAALEPVKPHAWFADVALARRARAVRAELEEANSALYQSVREQIRRGVAPETIRRRLLELGAGGTAAGEGYDALDDLIAGVLGLLRPRIRCRRGRR